MQPVAEKKEYRNQPGQDILFKDTPPGTYFLQPGLTSHLPHSPGIAKKVVYESN
jgi:hypothetical protein